ncbi:MAG: PaaI family thioesterase [Gemmatimonadetes bacterium]|nr:PaaI family thioesterase [Gemmatimonadota bacterium]
MTLEPVDPDFVQRIKASFSRQPFMTHIGARVVEVLPGKCIVEVQHRNELTQQHGFFHAGVIGAIADTAGGYAAYTLMEADTSVLSVEYKLNLLRPAVGDKLIATGEVVKSGRTISVCKSSVVVVKDGETKVCATALMTMMKMENLAEESA